MPTLSADALRDFRPDTLQSPVTNLGAWGLHGAGQKRSLPEAAHDSSPSKRMGSGSVAMDKRVLILDDDELVGRTMAMMCEGCEARLSTDADSFFEIYDQWDPSYVVLDLAMPEMDGIEIMRAIKRRVYRAAIIIASGMGGRVIDSARSYAQAHGLTIAGILEKPIAAGQLRTILDSDAAVRLSAARAPEPIPAISAAADAELQQAVLEGGILPYYQPRIDTVTGLLAGFEVVPYWPHPELGILPPERFLAQTERLGLIDQLTGRIANTALEWFASFQAQGFGLTLSISIPRSSLHSDMALSLLRQRADKLDIDRRRITLEVTEGATMTDPAQAVETFTRLRAAGFGVAIDDFATGHYALSQLFRLPVSELKIEQDLVETMHASRESRAIIKSIIDIAGNLDLRVTAEGVADGDSFRELKALGCEYLQGALIAPAMPVEAVSDWTEAWQGPLLEDGMADKRVSG